MRRNHVEPVSVVIATLAAAAFVQAVPGNGAVSIGLRAAAALPLLFVLPGWAIGLALGVPHGRGERLGSEGWLESWTWTAAISIALAVGGAFVLNVLPVGLTLTSWTVALTSATIAGASVALVRGATRTPSTASPAQAKSGHDAEFRRAPREREPQAGGRRMLAGALVVAALAMGLAWSSAKAETYPGFTQLWFVEQDNFQAGTLIGRWAKAKFEKEGKQARIAMLDLSPNRMSIDVKRDQGFLFGFGIDVADREQIGDESDPRIVGHEVTDGVEEGGRRALENLLQKDPSINLVYTINVPAAAGAYEAVKAAARQNDVTIVSVDDGCPGVAAVKAGQIGATTELHQLKMAQESVQAIGEFPEDRTITDIGVNLITDQPQDGVASQDTTFGQQNCGNGLAVEPPAVLAELGVQNVEKRPESYLVSLADSVDPTLRTWTFQLQPNERWVTPVTVAPGHKVEATLYHDNDSKVYRRVTLQGR